MKVAVIGAGLFGITAALKLREAGHEVVLYERYNKILQAASGINQYRLHRGYHYPRSSETIEGALASEASFRDMFGPVIIDTTDHYYAIAREGSKTSVENFVALCKRFNLFLVEEDPGGINHTEIAASFRVKEALIDPHLLYEFCKVLLVRAGIEVRFNTSVTASEIRNQFDYVVVATYAHLNETTGKSLSYQYELCEKPVLRLPEHFSGKSIVVIDGPFACIDPFGRTGNHVMGNVVHAVHATNVGAAPHIPSELLPLLNRGVITNPPLSAVKKFIEHGSKFFKGIEDSEYIGSMYTIRTVLPQHEATDARPTLVTRVDEKVISVFSGKLVQCVEAAEQVVALIPRGGNEPVLQSARRSPESLG